MRRSPGDATSSSVRRGTVAPVPSPLLYSLVARPSVQHSPASSGLSQYHLKIPSFTTSWLLLSRRRLTRTHATLSSPTSRRGSPRGRRQRLLRKQDVGPAPDHRSASDHQERGRLLPAAVHWADSPSSRSLSHTLRRIRRTPGPALPDHQGRRPGTPEAPESAPPGTGWRHRRDRLPAAVEGRRRLDTRPCGPGDGCQSHAGRDASREPGAWREPGDGRPCHMCSRGFAGVTCSCLPATNLCQFARFAGWRVRAVLRLDRAEAFGSLG